jgi:hypothetical protein
VAERFEQNWNWIFLFNRGIQFDESGRLPHSQEMDVAGSNPVRVIERGVPVI